MEPSAPSPEFLDAMDKIKEKEEQLIQKERELVRKEMELETKRKELEQSDKAVKDELVREVNKLKTMVNMWEEEEVERLTRAKAAKEWRDR